MKVDPVMANVIGMMVSSCGFLPPNTSVVVWLLTVKTSFSRAQTASGKMDFAVFFCGAWWECDPIHIAAIRYAVDPALDHCVGT